MEAKLAPKMPQWMVDHANKYMSSGGKDGHIYKIKPPGYGDLEVPALLLTTTGRKSGEKYIFPLFYGTTGNSYIVVASKGGAPEHPGWYKNILGNPEVEVQVGTKKLKARARTTSGAERASCGRRPSSSGRPTPTTRRRPSARFRSWCSTRFSSCQSHCHPEAEGRGTFKATGKVPRFARDDNGAVSITTKPPS